MKLISILIAIVLTVSSVHGEERVKGGVFALPGDYPYVVSIAVQGNHTCAGFLYNSEWVVTTASCVENVLLFETQVVVGQLSLITEDVPYEKRYDIFSVIIYDQYNSVSKLHDLALLQVAQKVEFSPNVTCIYYDETDVLADKGEIMGWGATFDGATIPSTRMRKGVISNLTADCTGYAGFDRNYQICVGDPVDSVTPCRFDEGGPLVPDIPSIGKVVVGIFSRTLGCEAGKPAVYTRLAPYYAWFEKIAKKQPVSPAADTCYDSNAV